MVAMSTNTHFDALADLKHTAKTATRSGRCGMSSAGTQKNAASITNCSAPSAPAFYSRTSSAGRESTEGARKTWDRLIPGADATAWSGGEERYQAISVGIVP